MKNFRSRTRRFTPAVVGTAALVMGVAVLEFGLGTSPSASGEATVAAADAAPIDRGDAQAATRGSGRTPESQFPAASAAIVTTTTEAPTTTSTSTSTTEAPTTTTSTTEAPTTTSTTQVAAAKSSSGNTQTGGASYYAYKAGGCAHKTIPKGTTVTVTNVSTGKSTTCVVNDRGPFVAGRIIDLDTSVFKQLASTSQGVFQARISW